MKVTLGTIEVDDDVRRALRKHAGEPGLATRDEVRSWTEKVLNCAQMTILDEAFRPGQPPADE